MYNKQEMRKNKSENCGLQQDISHSWTYQSGEVIRILAIPHKKRRANTEVRINQLFPTPQESNPFAYEKPYFDPAQQDEDSEDMEYDGGQKKQFYRQSSEKDKVRCDSVDQKFILCPMCNSKVQFFQKNLQLQKINKLRQDLIVCQEDQAQLKKSIQNIAQTNFDLMEITFKKNIQKAVEISQQNFKEKLWKEIQVLQEKFHILKKNDEIRKNQLHDLQIKYNTLRAQKKETEIKGNLMNKKLMEENSQLRDKIFQLERSLNTKNEESGNCFDINANSPPTRVNEAKGQKNQI